MKDYIYSAHKEETAILVGLTTEKQTEKKTEEYLDELEFLAETAGAKTVKRFTQKIVQPHAVTYVGSGKLEEIGKYIKDEAEEGREISMAIFDDELSAKQIRNIEKELQIKILDRTSLILDIFAQRAQSREGQLQVELAQYKYLLPRLTGMWTHLVRQTASGGLRNINIGCRDCNVCGPTSNVRAAVRVPVAAKARLVCADREKRSSKWTVV